MHAGRSGRRRLLQKNIERLQRVLGLHVGLHPHTSLAPETRAHHMAQLQSCHSEMDALLNEEAREWIQRRERH